MRQLWQLYADTVLPLEQKAGFTHFYGPPVTMEEFEARPQVLLLGQYSTGKTSMVKWLTGVFHGNCGEPFLGVVWVCLS